MDFISVWKALSIVLTGGFGILGLLKEYKDKNTDRITRWGAVSLIGILLSTSLGVVAQLKESWQQQQAGALAANETLALAKKTDQTVRELQRLLSPLEVREIRLRVRAGCEYPLFQATCKARNNDLSKVLDLWHRRRANIPPFVLDLLFFRDPQKAQLWLTGNQLNSPDLLITIVAIQHTSSDQHRFYFKESLKDDASLEGEIYDGSPFLSQNNSRIASMTDLRGATVLVVHNDFSQPDNLLGLTPVDIEITTKNGQSLTSEGIEIVRPAATALGFRSTPYVGFKAVFPE